MFKKFIALIPWCFALSVLLSLFFIRFPLRSMAQYSFPLDRTRIEFDTFLPAERVTSVGQQIGGWTGQRIIDEPVYASARSPGVYDRVDLLLEVSSTHPLALGILRDPKTWGIELHSVMSDAERLPDGWVKVHTSFDLSYPQDQLKFILSVPEIKGGKGSIGVRKVDIRYSRPPLSLKEWVRVMRREFFLIRQRL